MDEGEEQEEQEHSNGHASIPQNSQTLNLTVRIEDVTTHFSTTTKCSQIEFRFFQVLNHRMQQLVIHGTKSSLN